MPRDKGASERTEGGLSSPAGLYHAVLDALTDPIHVVDADLSLLFRNAAFVRWCGELGLSPLVVGQTVLEAFPFLPDRVCEEYREVFQTARPLVTEDISTVGDRQIITETEKIPLLTDGKVERVITVVRDVSDRVRAETALRENEERLGAILSSLHETAIVVYDSDGRVLSAWTGPGMEERYGLEAREACGRRLRDIYPSPIGEERTARIREVLRTGESVLDEYTATFPGGRFWLETTLSPMRDASGNVVAAVAFVRDTTERNQAETALRNAHAKLVNAQERERRRLAGELHDSIGQAMIAAHYRIESLRAEARSSGAVSLANQLDELATQCNELIREVRQVGHGLFPPTLEQLGLAAALRQLLTVCKLAGIEAAVRVPEDVEALRVGEDAEIGLFRIAQEAVHNAIRHAGCRTLHVELTCANSRFTLAVVNDGEPFRPERAAGKGLGLNSMRERAEAIGGTLTITSKPGCTRVEASVPIGPSPGAPSTPPEDRKGDRPEEPT